VKVFLLPLDSQRSFFYYEDDADASGPSDRAAHGGLRGFLERTYQRVHRSLRHPSGSLTKRIKRLKDWLERRVHPDEPLLAALRSAATIEVHHGLSLSSARARELWCRYLRARRRRHLLWLAFDGALAPLSVLLAPLPGPNLIGYWFAYRAVHQLVILHGIRRASSGRLETMFHPVAVLDGPGGSGNDQWLARAAEQYELNGLQDFVARMSPQSATSTAKTRDESGGQDDHATPEL
jgi:hypothetical protein